MGSSITTDGYGLSVYNSSSVQSQMASAQDTEKWTEIVNGVVTPVAAKKDEWATLPVAQKLAFLNTVLDA